MTRKSTLTFTLGILLALAIATAIWLWMIGRDEAPLSYDTGTPSSQQTDPPATDDDEDSEPTTSYTSEGGVDLVVEEPLSETAVNSPLSVSGSVPGSWSFEASFPLLVTDSEGNVLGEAPAELQGEWMTEELVPFTGTIDFDASGASNGYLVLEKSNPSGLEENADQLRIPIRFE